MQTLTGKPKTESWRECDEQRSQEVPHAMLDWYGRQHLAKEEKGDAVNRQIDLGDTDFFGSVLFQQQGWGACDLTALWLDVQNKMVLCDWKPIDASAYDTAFKFFQRKDIKLPLVFVYDSELEKEFNERADRWERETAIHSSPSATYLHRDYIAIIARGMENRRVIVPLILNRIPNTGADWFFALENIAGENPAKDAEDFESAYKAWCQWAEKNGLMKDADGVRAA